ncbi:MAG: EAL domain-containing protein [Azoarcus sp.]|jgi:diguanylate cyclase (GGDEF)-like protein/PAS domain S-box-containing protein|nr:EAL domain-containing protein [Azoarcus sp.]
MPKKHLALSAITVLFWVLMWAWVAVDMHITYERDREVTTNNARIASRVLEGHMQLVAQKMDMHLRDIILHFRQGIVTKTNTHLIDESFARNRDLFPEVKAFHISDEAGKPIASSDGKAIDIAGRDYFKRLRDNPAANLVIDGPLASLDDGSCIVVFARRIVAPSGAFAGTVSAMAQCQYFQHFTEDLDLRADTAINLFTEDLDLIARVPPAPEFVGKSATNVEPLRAALAEGQTEGDYLRTSGIDGVERYYYFHKMTRVGLPFVMLIGQSKAFVLEEWYQRASIYAVLCSLITLISFFGLRAWLRRYDDVEKLAERLTRDMEEKTRETRIMMDAIPDPAWMTDLKGTFLAINKALQEFLGREQKDMVNHPVAEFYPPELTRTFVEHRETVIETGAACRQSAWITGRDLKTRPFEILRVPVFDDQQRMYRVVGVAREMTEHYEAEARQQMITKLFDHDSEGLVVLDSNQRIVIVNQTFSRLIGYAQEELLGHYPSEFFTEEFDRPFVDKLTRSLEDKGFWNGEFALRAKNGDAKPVSCRVVSLIDQHHHSKNWIVFMNDLSERKEVEQRIKLLVTVDTLTSLPNRRGFLDILNDQLTQGSARVLLVLHMSRLNRINDAFGHNAGDALLQRTGNRIRELLRANDVVGRLGDNNFGILLVDIDQQDVIMVVQKIIATVAKPVIFEGQSLTCPANVGGCNIGKNAPKAEVLLRQADAAMRHAREAGINTYRFFSEDLGAELVRRVQRENELRGALERRELRLLYQPQVDIASGRIVGCEALLRWKHPYFGTVSPLEFVPLAEDSGLILTIGQWVLEEACRQAKRWQVAGLPPLTMAVNVSAVQLRHDKLIGDISMALQESGLAPSWLELEITESILLEERLGEILRDLTSLGIAIAIDDFGTGYSSLAYLRHFPFNKLKIDQSFIRDVCTDKGAAAIVRMVVGMARELHLQTIAEGVEDERQLAFLAGCDCQEYQGYLCSKPVTAEEFVKLFEQTAVEA